MYTSFVIIISLMHCCSVAQEVHRFSTNLKPWLDTALKGLPDSLRTVKSNGNSNRVYYCVKSANGYTHLRKMNDTLLDFVD